MATKKKLLDNNGVLYLWNKVKLLPVSTFTNDAKYVTEDQIPSGSAASDSDPTMNGTASAGASDLFARGDHVHPSDTSKVDKVDGKGLSTNDFDDTYKQKLDDLDTTIQNKISSVHHIHKEVVESLPEAGSAEENVIYLVSQADGTDEGNIYKEYMLINGSMELIGDTDIDLTDYVQDADIELISNAELDTICV